MEVVERDPKNDYERTQELVEFVLNWIEYYYIKEIKEDD